MRKLISMLFAVTLALGFITNANAAKTLKCQTVLNCLLYTSDAADE